MELLVGAVILATVGLFQVQFIRRARTIKKEVIIDDCSDLRVQFIGDIMRRAGHGDGPDWLRYIAEFEQLYAAKYEGLRHLANSAIVTGIAGTMAAVIGHIIAFQVSGRWEVRGLPADPTGYTVESLASELAPVLMFALFSSLFGVLVHILLLYWLSSAEQAGAQRWVDLRSHLRDAAEEHPSKSGLLDSIRISLVESFEGVAGRFPEVFATLDQNVSQLRIAIQEHSESVGKMSDLLQGSSAMMRETAIQVGAVAETLDDSVESLRDLPSQIEGLSVSAQKIVESVQQIPNLFHAETVEISRVVAREFAREVRVHIAEFRGVVDDCCNSLRISVDKTAQRMERAFIESSEKVIPKVIESFVERFEESFLNRTELVISAVDRTVAAFEAATDRLPRDARSFADALCAADANLQASIECLRDVAEEFGSIAQSLGQFEESTARALTSAAGPVLVQVSETSAQISSSHMRVEKTIQELILFIRRQVEYLARMDDASGL